MHRYKILSLDETGKASYAHPSELFILSGVIIPEKFKPKLDVQMKKLKKKFFNNEDIVFHSRDMSRKKGPFANLREPKKEIAFWSEFITVTNTPDITVAFIIANKSKAKVKSWHQKTILKRSYLKILEGFASKQLNMEERGKIVVESDPAQDLYLIEAHNRIQGVGLSDGSLTASEYREKITSLSLVKKSNLDIDIQIADALAPIAGLIYRTDYLKDKHVTMNKIEQMKKRLIKRKLANQRFVSIFDVLI